MKKNNHNNKWNPSNTTCGNSGKNSHTKIKKEILIFTDNENAASFVAVVVGVFFSVKLHLCTISISILKLNRGNSKEKKNGISFFNGNCNHVVVFFHLIL